MRAIREARLIGLIAGPADCSIARIMMLAGMASTANAITSIIAMGPPNIPLAMMMAITAAITRNCITTVLMPAPPNAMPSGGGDMCPSAV